MAYQADAPRSLFLSIAFPHHKAQHAQVNQHHYERIDRGMKREMRKEARSQPRTSEGTFLPVVSTEKRLEIVQSVPAALKAGKTTTQIAESYGIQPRTLRSWLISDETTEQARGEFLSHEIVARAEDIDLADNPLPLARAREAFKAWSWIAERREARLFGQKQEVTHKGNAPVLSITIVDNSGNLVDSLSTNQHTSVMSNTPELPKK